MMMKPTSRIQAKTNSGDRALQNWSTLTTKFLDQLLALQLFLSTEELVTLDFLAPYSEEEYFSVSEK